MAIACSSSTSLRCVRRVACGDNCVKPACPRRATASARHRYPSSWCHDESALGGDEHATASAATIQRAEEKLRGRLRTASSTRARPITSMSWRSMVSAASVWSLYASEEKQASAKRARGMVRDNAPDFGVNRNATDYVGVCAGDRAPGFQCRCLASSPRRPRECSALRHRFARWPLPAGLS